MFIPSFCVCGCPAMLYASIFLCPAKLYVYALLLFLMPWYALNIVLWLTCTVTAGVISWSLNTIFISCFIYCWCVNSSNRNVLSQHNVWEVLRETWLSAGELPRHICSMNVCTLVKQTWKPSRKNLKKTLDNGECNVRICMHKELPRSRAGMNITFAWSQPTSKPNRT